MIVALTTRRRFTVGTLLLIAFGAVWVAANAGATAARLASPMSTWQVRADYDGVTHVAGVCGVDNAGAKPVQAQTMDLQRTDREAVVRLVIGMAQEGRTQLEVTYTGKTQPETITAYPENRCAARSATRLLRSLGAVAMLVLASILLLRLPSITAFGFFLFVLGFSPMTQGALNSYLPIDGAVMQNLLNDVFEGAGLWGIVIFCEGLGERVTHLDVHSAGNVAIRWVIAIIAVVATVLSVVADVRLEMWREPGKALFVSSQALIAIGALLATALLFSTYFASDPKTRARMRWICWSFAIGMPLYLVGYVSDNVPFIPLTLPDPVVDLLYLAIALIPAAVTYALLRHHVMDAGIYVSRGTVYAVVVVLLIMVVEALMEWARPLVESIPVLTIIAVFFVVSFHPITEWGTKLLQRWLAKDRVRALSDLRRSSRKFALVKTFGELEVLMVRSAASSLKLSGAALVSQQRIISATDSYADHAEALEGLANDLALRDALDASTAAVRLPRARYEKTLADFTDDVVPLVAIALENPGLPFHVFVVGPHLDGTDLDKEELDALDDFVERGLIAHVVMTLREIEKRIGMEGSPLTE